MKKLTTSGDHNICLYQHGKLWSFKRRKWSWTWIMHCNWEAEKRKLVLEMPTTWNFEELWWTLDCFLRLSGKQWNVWNILQKKREAYVRNEHWQTFFRETLECLKHLLEKHCNFKTFVRETLECLKHLLFKTFYISRWVFPLLPLVLWHHSL